MSQIPSNPSNAGARRRSQRVLMQVSVRVHGIDAQGKPFDEEADTLAINAHGALVLLHARLTSGSLLTLRGNKAEIGLEFSARRPQFWRVAFPPEDWSPKDPEARKASQPRPVTR